MLPLSDVDGTVLETFFNLDLYSFPKWLAPLEASRTKISKAEFISHFQQSSLNFCYLVFQLAHLYVFLRPRLNRAHSLQWYYKVAAGQVYDVFNEFLLLLTPLYTDFRCRCLLQRSVSLSSVIDRWYVDRRSLDDARSTYCNLLLYLAHLPDSPDNPTWALFVGSKQSSHRRLMAAEGTLHKSSEESRGPSNLDFMKRAVSSLYLLLEAVGFSAPAVETGKMRVKWTCVSSINMFGSSELLYIVSITTRLTLTALWLRDVR